MAARFTHRDHSPGTHTVQRGKAKEPGTRSDREHLGSPQSGNTMNGMPSWIDAHEKIAKGQNPGNVRGGKTISPKGPPGAGARGGPGQGRSIGKRGGGNTAGRLQRGGAGTMGGREAWMGGEGHRGRMERLAGKAKAFNERKGSRGSNMY